jgi:hypothetical protein
MTQQRDIERLLDQWFSDGPAQAPDRVVDIVTDRIERQSQRPAWRLHWRPSPVHAYAKIAVAAAAVLIVAIVGYNLLPGGSAGVGGPAPTVNPTATPVPTVTPTATPVPILPEGTLAAGTYRLRPFVTSTMTIDATVPAGGWLGGVPNAISGPRGNSNGPNGVVVAFLKAQTIHSDPCQWDHDGSGSAPQEGDVAVGPTVDDLVAALGASTTYESTTPVDATLGGFSGKRLELQLTPGPSGCDSYDGAGNQYWVFGGRDGALYAQGDANRWQLTIVDVDGTRLIGVLVSYAETSGEDLSAAQEMLDSVVITP